MIWLTRRIDRNSYTDWSSTHIACIIINPKLNRAGKKNALTRVMYTAMADALNAAASDPEVRVVVLAGQLECFSAGNDLVDFMQSPPGIKGAPVGAFMEALANFPKPVVAAR